jgi:hypothetical protein
VKRRHFLAATLATLATPALAAPKKKARLPTATAEHSILESVYDGSSASRLPQPKPPGSPATWQTVALRHELKLETVRAGQRLVLPLPIDAPLWQHPKTLRWQGNPQSTELFHLPHDTLHGFIADWSGRGDPQLTLEMTAQVAERRLDISRRTAPPDLEAPLRAALAETDTLPNGGKALTLARQIVGRIVDPLAQAHALYDWVSANARYDPALPPEGSGDVRAQLEAARYGGRSADIAGLFVALCRAIGIPARRLHGVRVAPSAIAPCLGLETSDAKTAQHCRAEFYIPGYAWIAVDVSDVCRFAAQEPDNRALLDKIRQRFFGFWETNWLALSVAENLILRAEAVPRRQPDGLPVGQARDLSIIPPVAVPLPFLNAPLVFRTEDGQRVEKFDWQCTASSSGAAPE